MDGLKDLPKKISKGPKEQKGKINYHYQHLDNSYNFLALMVIENSKYKSLCIPNFKVFYKKNVLRNAIVFDTTDNTYWIPDKAKKAIKKCIKYKIRYITCSLNILYGNYYLSHYNILLIDIENKTIERFEPYGWSLPYTKMVNNFIKTITLEKLGLPNYKYIPPEKISKKLGIQSVADSYDGMCITISLLYLHLRLNNPKLKQKKIVNNLLSLERNILKNLILKFAKYIEKLLKKKYNIVNELNQDLFRKK